MQFLSKQVQKKIKGYKFEPLFFLKLNWITIFKEIFLKISEKLENSNLKLQSANPRPPAK